MLREVAKKLFTLYGDKMVKQLIGRLNSQKLNATGNAARSLRYEAEEDTLDIYGPSYMFTLNDGRKPGHHAPVYNNTQGYGLLRWVQQKMAPGADLKSQKSMAFRVAASIKEKGTIKRFSQGGLSNYGGSGLLDFVLNKNLPMLADQLGKRVGEDMLKEIAAEARKNLQTN